MVGLMCLKQNRDIIAKFRLRQVFFCFQNLDATLKLFRM